MSELHTPWALNSLNKLCKLNDESKYGQTLDIIMNKFFNLNLAQKFKL